MWRHQLQTVVLLFKTAAKLMNVGDGAGTFHMQHVTVLRQVETEQTAMTVSSGIDPSTFLGAGSG